MAGKYLRSCVTFDSGKTVASYSIMQLRTPGLVSSRPGICAEHVPVDVIPSDGVRVPLMICIAAARITILMELDSVYGVCGSAPSCLPGTFAAPRP